MPDSSDSYVPSWPLRWKMLASCARSAPGVLAKITPVASLTAPICRAASSTISTNDIGSSDTYWPLRPTSMAGREAPKGLSRSNQYSKPLPSRQSGSGKVRWRRNTSPSSAEHRR
ncbi:hypothetical protein D3C72_2166840 [compost metagenome]